MPYSKETIKGIYRSLPRELSEVVATEETLKINDEIFVIGDKIGIKKSISFNKRH